jgi:DNA-binding IclR family transcriptional regulator
MPEAECEATITAIAPHLDRYAPITADDIRFAAGQARATGFAESWGKVAEGVYGLGIAIPSGTGSMLALSISAHQSLATDANIQAWRQRLKAAAGQS